jgi:hypothetical protein
LGWSHALSSMNDSIRPIRPARSSLTHQRIRPSRWRGSTHRWRRAIFRRHIHAGTEEPVLAHRLLPAFSLVAGARFEFATFGL